MRTIFHSIGLLSAAARRQPKHRCVWHWLTLIAALGAPIVAGAQTRIPARRVNDASKSWEGNAKQSLLNAPLATAIRRAEDHDVWHVVVIEPGDTLSEVLNRLGLPASDWLALSRLDGGAERLIALKPGDRLRIRPRPDDHLGALTYRLGAMRTLEVAHKGASFDVRISRRSGEVRRAYSHGRIESSLYQAAARQDVPAGVIAEMARQFARRLDLSRSLRAGARFAVIYDQTWRAGMTSAAGVCARRCYVRH